MTTAEQIRKALSAHAYWKVRLLDAVAAGRYPMKPEEVQLDHLCEFGQWLYGPEISPAIRSSPIYRNVKELHAQFHREAAKVVQLLTTGQSKKAREALQAGGYARTSAALTEALNKWRSASVSLK